METPQLTWIAKFIWVLTNRKPEHRKGKVQLIDATQWFKPLRTLDEIHADILAVEKEMEGLLEEIIGGSAR